MQSKGFFEIVNVSADGRLSERTSQLKGCILSTGLLGLLILLCPLHLVASVGRASLSSLFVRSLV